ncbi:MAG TPA: hypothetical protein VLC92_07915 [Rhodocyclaceae bacterium]|nr:hypothetical protein [Rhodocyclaceae bacterium]
MSPILPIGDFLSVDADGYLVNPCRRELITPPWSDVVAALTTACQQQLGQQMHSLYVRGSVAKGTAIAGVSDIDAIAVIYGEREDVDRSWVAAFQQRMEVQYPFHTGIELPFLPHRAIHDAKEAQFWRFLIKTQCVCLCGEDLATAFPRYKAGRALAWHVLSIEEDIRDVVEQLPLMEDVATIKDDCQWIMKRVVRTGFELIMDYERTYTRDLYPCYAAFSRHFPAQEPQMRHALTRAIEPSDSKQELGEFLDGFGAWIVTAASTLGFASSAKTGG